MQLTKQSEYALQGVAFLAAQPNQNPVPLAEVAEAQNLPSSFLAKIFQNLARHGVLAAERGPGSGYYLARDPGTLKVRDIVEAVEGPRVFERCLFWPGHCADASPCPLHSYFKHLKPTVQSLLDSITLAEYVRHADHEASRT